MNALVKSQVKVMTDDGKYCSFRSMYGVTIKNMLGCDYITENNYFQALKKLGVIERLGAAWTAPEHIRNEMVEQGLAVLGIYRRKSSVKEDGTHNYSYGFNCADETVFIEDVLNPVILELEILDEALATAWGEIEKAKDALRTAGQPTSLINPSTMTNKVVAKWEK